MGSRKKIPGDATEAKWPWAEKVESVLSTVQGNSVICLVRVNDFPPFTLKVKYGLVSLLYHKDASFIHPTLHSLLLFVPECLYLICLPHSVLTSHDLSTSLSEKPVLLQFSFH